MEAEKDTKKMKREREGEREISKRGHMDKEKGAIDTAKRKPKGVKLFIAPSSHYISFERETT